MCVCCKRQNVANNFGTQWDCGTVRSVYIASRGFSNEGVLMKEGTCQRRLFYEDESSGVTVLHVWFTVCSLGHFSGPSIAPPNIGPGETLSLSLSHTHTHTKKKKR